MVNIGLDFGSTYTMVSVLDNGEIKTVQPDGLSYSYPSLVAYDTVNKKYFFGNNAKSKVNKRNFSFFKGFKMMLNDQMNAQEMKKRKFGSVNTPELVTEKFLEYVINNTLEKLGEDRIGTLVVGAPECWFKSFETVDARGTLKSICKKFKNVDEVKIISEPIAAAAFCVWNYEKDTKKAFDGNILVVDYGGGTLDTSLVSVSHINGKIRMKAEERSGSGENRDGQLGKAGIAYQEAVLKKAICEALNIQLKDIEYGNDFNKALKELEEALIYQKINVEDTFDTYIAIPDSLVEEELVEVAYKKKDVTINYKHLLDAYNETIAPTLKKVLDETMASISSDSETIYLALVGGFGNFYLVKKQVNDYFKDSEMIANERNIVRQEENREKAITNGALLFSEGIIEICHIADVGIGMYSVYENGEVFKKYAINYMQEYKPNKIYFTKDDHGEIASMILTTLDKFILSFSKNPEAGFLMRPKRKFAEQLRNIDVIGIVAVGFSIDQDEKICMHIFDYDTDPKHFGIAEQPRFSITLSTYKDSFENTIINIKK